MNAVDSIDHPTETARQTLLLAADVEDPDWARIFHRAAQAIPRRPPVTPEELADLLLARRRDRIAELRGELDRLGADILGDD